MKLKISEKEKNSIIGFVFFLVCIAYLALAFYVPLAIFKGFTDANTLYNNIASNTTLITSELKTINENPQLYFYKRGELYFVMGEINLLATFVSMLFTYFCVRAYDETQLYIDKAKKKAKPKT